MTTRETNRLHRWAMWRMSVNEGIISCIRDNGTTRVIYPESSSDSSSVGSAAVVPDFHEFPFITPEQLSLARKLNLREKYGTHHGLSDDAYFIFGLPRITISKDVPEVTSTGTRSMYESFSEYEDTPANLNNSRARTLPVAVDPSTADISMTLQLTYPGSGPTLDTQSLASNDDMEVQRINGYREEWKSPVPSPRLNLYNIQEELNNNDGQFTTYRSPDNAPFLGNNASTGKVAYGNKYSLTSGPAYDVLETTRPSQESGANNGQLASPRRNVYPPFFSSGRQQSISPTRTSFSPPSPPQRNYSPQSNYPAFPAMGKQRYSPLPTSLDRQGYSPMPTSPRQSGVPSSSMPTSPRQSGFPLSLVPTSPRQSGFPLSPVPTSPRQSGFRSSPLPTSPRENYFPSSPSPRQGGLPSSPMPTSPNQSGFPSSPRLTYPRPSGFPSSSFPTSPRQSGFPSSPFPTSPRQSGFPSSSFPTSPRQSGFPSSPFPTSPRESGFPSSPFPTSPRESGFPSSPFPTSPRDGGFPSSPEPISPRQSGFPSTSGGKSLGPPGYGNKMRPTSLMSDGEAERMKRQAYYDWGTPLTERFHHADFASQSRFS